MNSGWIYKLEKKFGKYCIRGLIRYVIAAELIGAVIGFVNPDIYDTFLSLNYAAIAKGQVWRFITFMFFPEVSMDMWNIIMFAIQIAVYYFIGNALERAWGSFRFNLFYFSGILLSYIAALMVFLFMGFYSLPGAENYLLWPAGLQYINETLFLAFALMFPDVEFLLFFLLPVRAKWLGIVYGAFLAWDVVKFVLSGTAYGYMFAIAIVIQILNFIIFFISSKKGSRGTHKQRQMQREFKQQTAPKVTPIYRHRCAICGRTERDNPDLEFRYCSKCEGNYEYCSDHIFTHEHVHTGQ